MIGGENMRQEVKDLKEQLKEEAIIRGILSNDNEDLYNIDIDSYDKQVNFTDYPKNDSSALKIEAMGYEITVINS